MSAVQFSIDYGGRNPGRRKNKKGKAKSKPNPPAKPSQPPPPSQPTGEPWWNRTWVAVAGILTLVATLSGLYQFFSSSVSVNPGEPLNQQAHSAPFTITNTSEFFTLTNIEPSCYIVGEKFKSGITMKVVNNNYYAAPIPELAPGGFDTLYCENLAGFPGDATENADVIVNVHYSTHLRRRADLFRFITRTKSDGKLMWVHYGIKDDNPNFQQKP